jgi:hypothetical protein
MAVSPSRSWDSPNVIKTIDRRGWPVIGRNERRSIISPIKTELKRAMITAAHRGRLKSSLPLSVPPANHQVR